ncbi:hypothetical protein CK507_02565 [Pseudomonas sp. WN033]|nr:hypothetical protein CK507_02565 [Pseudomonas sp. WN033]
MRITWADRIKALFARDEYSYWFALITDEEKELRRMDSWELAKVIHEESVHQTNPERRIVAEHMLQIRVAKIQSRATYVSVVVGFLGVLAGVVLTTAIQCGT